MASPTRLTSGFTQDAKFQPLGNIGIPNPFFYSDLSDDFIPYRVGDYTVTAAGGSIAAAAASTANGTGGRILFTTGAIATNFAALQSVVATHVKVIGKKLVFLTRIQAADVTNSIIQVGLIQTSATPYTVTDGIYLLKAAGAATVQLRIVTASALIGSVTLPASMVIGTDVDLGFVVDQYGNVKAFMGSPLVGPIRQDFAVLGPSAGVLNSALTGVLTTVGLNPSLAIQANSNAVQTMLSDFFLTAQER